MVGENQSILALEKPESFNFEIYCYSLITIFLIYPNSFIFH